MSIPALGLTQPPIKWIPRLLRSSSGGSVALSTHHLLVLKLKKEYSYTSSLDLGLRFLSYGDISLYLSCGEPQQAVLYLLTAAACFGICDGIQVLNTRYLKLKVN